MNETLAVLDLKLAVIPDSPVKENDGIFDTKYATDIVEKAEKKRRKLERKLRVIELNLVAFLLLLISLQEKPPVLTNMQLSIQ